MQIEGSLNLSYLWECSSHFPLHPTRLYDKHQRILLLIVLSVDPWREEVYQLLVLFSIVLQDWKRTAYVFYPSSCSWTIVPIEDLWSHDYSISSTHLIKFEMCGPKDWSQNLCTWYTHSFSRYSLFNYFLCEVSNLVVQSFSKWSEKKMILIFKLESLLSCFHKIELRKAYKK